MGEENEQHGEAHCIACTLEALETWCFDRNRELALRLALKAERQEKKGRHDRAADMDLRVRALTGHGWRGLLETAREARVLEEAVEAAEAGANR